MNFKILETTQKLNGAYYTPLSIAGFLARWVLRSQPKNILEPSCGDGAFFEALETALKEKNVSEKINVVGVDIDSNACAVLAERLRNREFKHLNGKLLNDDFLKFSLLSVANCEQYDAVIGNPPFIRYQYLEAENQTLTERIFELAHLPFTRHTNAWVPFVLQSLRLLKPGGRLAMVIPTEIMHVLHAQPLRQFIFKQCSKVYVIHVEDLFSEEVLQGVVLLLCEKKMIINENGTRISFPQLSINQLCNGVGKKIMGEALFKKAADLTHKWTVGLLSDVENTVYQKTKANRYVHNFVDIADVDVGIVTGANDFFLVTDEIINKFNLGKYTAPMFGRSSHVQGVIFTTGDCVENAKNGLPTNFLQFPAVPFNSLPDNVKDYILTGERVDLHKRYKCRIRTPWYCVPSVWASDVAMLKRAHTVPRLILNKGNAYTTDTAYRIKMKPEFSKRGEELVGCFVNSFTALSAELEGRHYGGGVIELVPSEIERLSIPLPQTRRSNISELDKAYRQNKPIEEIMAKQDKWVLEKIGLNDREIEILNSAWRRLMKRRMRDDSVSELSNQSQ